MCAWTVHQLALLDLSLVVLLESLVVYSMDELMVIFSIMLMLRQSFFWSLRWARFTSIDLLLIWLSLSQIWSSNTRLLLRSSQFWKPLLEDTPLFAVSYIPDYLINSLQMTITVFFFYEDGTWTIKGRYEHALETDEDVCWKMAKMCYDFRL